MNILFITTHANTGGITSYILTLGGALVKSGHRVWVVSNGGDSVERMEASGMKHRSVIVRTKSEINPRLWFSLPGLQKFIQEEKIDIIHAQTRVTQVLGTALSRMTGVPLITTCHGFFKPRWFRRVFPCWGKAVIAISKPVAEHLKKDFGIAAHLIYLVPNGIDLQRFVPTNAQRRIQARQSMQVSDGIPLIGIIARLSDVKGINVLLNAMPLVLKEIPQAHLMVIGQGPEEDNLKKQTHSLSLDAHVHFQKTINKTAELLAGFDMFVMPSLMEGLGLSVIEAQACCIPVVASNIGGLPDLIENGITGFLVPSNDAKALASGIVKMLQSPEICKVMIAKARFNVERHFSDKIMAQKVVEIYEQHSRR